MKYPGSKNASGIYQWIINNIPYHKRYFELFAGSGAIYYKKKPATINYLNDLSDKVVNFHLSQLLINTKITQFNTIDLIDKFIFTEEDFIYLDPPYPFSSRRSGKKYYQNEMTDADHIQLLQSLLSIRAKVMISTKKNDIYKEILKTWEHSKFLTIDRSGTPYYEEIYMNYSKPEILHEYTFVGNGFTDRQRITRKIDRFANKIKNLPAYEKHLFIQQLIYNDTASVKHFLSIVPEK